MNIKLKQKYKHVTIRKRHFSVVQQNHFKLYAKVESVEADSSYTLIRCRSALQTHARSQYIQAIHIHTHFNTHIHALIQT